MTLLAAPHARSHSALPLDTILPPALATALDSSGAVLLTTIGGGEGAGTEGVFMLSGPDELVAATSAAVAAALDGRGGGKGGRYQGKCKNVNGRDDAVAAAAAILEAM